MSKCDTGTSGTFIQAYDACKGYFEPMLEAKNAAFGVEIESREVPRDWHHCKTRGGSTRDRTVQSIASPKKNARTVSAALDQLEFGGYAVTRKPGQPQVKPNGSPAVKPNIHAGFQQSGYVQSIIRVRYAA